MLHPVSLPKVAAHRCLYDESILHHLSRDGLLHQLGNPIKSIPNLSTVLAQLALFAAIFPSLTRPRILDFDLVFYMPTNITWLLRNIPT